jgi:hypothetical protein
MIVNKNQSVSGALIGAGVGMPLLFLTMLLTGGGHGIYSPVFVCFPYMALVWLISLDTQYGLLITIPGCILAQILACIQFPIYGAILAGRSRQGLVQALLPLMGAHFIAAMLALEVAAARGVFLP